MSESFDDCMPMKEEPRDGTPVLLFRGVGECPFIGYWATPFAYVKEGRASWIGHEYGLHEDGDLLGWMPLSRVKNV